MTMLWIAGNLDVRATRAELPALDLGVSECIDLDRAISPEPRSLKCAPIVLRDRNGAIEILSWRDSNGDCPRFSPRDSVEVWVIEEKDLDETPGLSKAVRFCLYKLARVKSNIKSKKESKKLRQEALADIENDQELRSVIAQHVLQVDEKDVLQPRYLLPLLGEQIVGRTLQNDLADIRRENEQSETESTQNEENSSEFAEITDTNIIAKSFGQVRTEELDDQATPVNNQDEKVLGANKELDSRTEDECLEREYPRPIGEDTKSSQTETVTHQTDPASATQLGHSNPEKNPPQNDPDDKLLAIGDEQTEIQSDVGLYTAEALRDTSHFQALAEASRLYERLKEFDPELPDFDSIMEVFQGDDTVGGDKKIRTFVNVITKRADEITTAPKRPAANIKKYLDRFF